MIQIPFTPPTPLRFRGHGDGGGGGGGIPMYYNPSFGMSAPALMTPQEMVMSTPITAGREMAVSMSASQEMIMSTSVSGSASTSVSSQGMGGLHGMQGSEDRGVEMYRMMSGDGSVSGDGSGSVGGGGGGGVGMVGGYEGAQGYEGDDAGGVGYGEGFGGQQ